MNKLTIIGLLFCGLLLAGPVTIQRVIPNKILYRCNESGYVDVTVANDGEVPQTTTLRLAVEWDLEPQRSLGERAVMLAPGEVRTERFAWQTGSERYGRGVRAEVLIADRVVDSRREFCNVIDEWWRVQLVMGGFGANEDLRRRICAWYHVPYEPYEHRWYVAARWIEPAGPFLGYANHAFHFCSMPSVFGDHTPDPESPTKTWYSGNGTYPFTLAQVEKDAHLTRQWGVKSSQYTWLAFNGPSGFELARQYPEYVGRTATGAYHDAGFVPPNPITLSKGIHQRQKGWAGVMPNTWDVETVRWGARELVRGMQHFGWDGMFFDGCGYVVKPCYGPDGQQMPNGRDPDQVSARNIRATREVIHAALPEAYLWYNGANPAAAHNFWPKGNGGGRAGKIEMLADRRSGALRELQTSQILDRNHHAHAWRSFYEVLLAEREVHRQTDWGTPTADTTVVGAIHTDWIDRQIGADATRSRGQWAWGNHVMSMLAAAGLHPFGSGGSCRPMLQLMTRYSEFFWHEDVAIMEKAYKHFMVDSLRETWWEDSIYVRDTPAYRETIMCIVNSPDHEKAHPRIFTDPEPADDVEITLLDKHDANRFTAWAVLPYGYDAEVLEPQQTRLDSELVDGEVVFAVPPFTYFCMVIIREAK